MSYWTRYTESMENALRSLEVTDEGGRSFDAERAFLTICEWTATLRDHGGTLHLVGNGASAGMASHMAADWTKNAGIRATAYNDMAFLTAIANDLGYEHVFSGPLQWYAREEDVLATISSSGNSPNVIRAIAMAREKRCRIVTLSGMKPDNRSRRAGDMNFYVPALTYGITECSHQLILHAWLDRFMDVREWDATERQVSPPLRSP